MAIDKIAISNSGSTTVLTKHWGPQRLVTIRRLKTMSLGISIVGGKVDLYNAGPDSCSAISGIFVKNVLPNSPAGTTGQLKTGDRILEVDGIDLRQASHEYAVDVIRSSGNPVNFLVQSLVQWTSDGDTIKEINNTVWKSTSLTEVKPPYSIEATKELTKSEEIIKDKDFKKFIESSSDESEGEDDFTDLEGKTRTASGVEISRASAGNVKRSKEEIANDPEKEDQFGYTTNKVKKKYGNLEAGVGVVIAELTMERGCSGGLGISLAGHKDRTKMAVLIAGLNPSGRAYSTNQLQVGDEILEVNGVILQGRCHLNASAIIKGLPGPLFKIIALRKAGAIDELSVKPITQFPLSLKEETPEQRYASFKGLRTVSIKKTGHGLGIMIIEGKHTDVGQGIFISDIQEGSPAHLAGLNVGDMILSVNKDTLLGSNYDTAAALLKKTEGMVTLVVCNPNKAKDEENRKIASTPQRSLTPLSSTSPSRDLCKSATGTPRSLSPTASGKVKFDDDGPTLSAVMTPGIESTIEITRDRMALGIGLVGGSDTPLGSIFINEIYANGAAAKDGRLKCGDEILELNNENFKNITYDKAVTITRQTPAKVHLTVYRHENQNDDIKNMNIFEIELMKKPAKGLGLSISSKISGNNCLFISDILAGSVASLDGRLTKGDVLLAVNGTDLSNITPEQAAIFIKIQTGKIHLKLARYKPR